MTSLRIPPMNHPPYFYFLLASTDTALTHPPIPNVYNTYLTHTVP
jgi:hypothetical protein